MQKVTFRKATSSDAVQVSELIQHTIRVSNSHDYDQQSIEAVCSSFSPERVAERIKGEHLLLCIDGLTLVGTAALRSDHLRSTFVHPERQGHGLGKMLVAHIEQLAREQSIPTLMVEASITARSFYESLGFELVEFLEHQQGSTFLMKKALA